MSVALREPVAPGRESAPARRARTLRRSLHDGTVHFTETWEDPRTDARALRVAPGDTVVAVTSGGCTPLSLLLERPGRLVAVDVNPAQSHLLELKVAALRRLSPEEMEAFLRSGPLFDLLYPCVRVDLAAAARDFWDRRVGALPRGLAEHGVASRIFYAVGRFLRRTHDEDELEAFFDCETLEDQGRAYRETFRHPVFRLLSTAVGPWLSRPRALRAILRSEYFPYITVRNVPRFLWERIDHVMTAVPAADNYFLARILLGRELDGPDGRPPYLRADRRSELLDALPALEVVTGDFQARLAAMEDDSVDRFQLSNLWEWMDEDALEPFLEHVVRVARPGARVFFRNLFTERSVPPSFAGRLRVDGELSDALLAGDRSLIYGKCCVAEVVG